MHSILAQGPLPTANLLALLVFGIVFLLILFVITGSDYWSRGWLGTPGS